MVIYIFRGSFLTVATFLSYFIAVIGTKINNKPMIMCVVSDDIIADISARKVICSVYP